MRWIYNQNLEYRFGQFKFASAHPFRAMLRTAIGAFIVAWAGLLAFANLTGGVTMTAHAATVPATLPLYGVQRFCAAWELFANNPAYSSLVRVHGDAERLRGSTGHVRHAYLEWETALLGQYPRGVIRKDSARLSGICASIPRTYH